MKVFQTIYTSAVSTLDNRQGLGRVFCSKSLPELIREKIAHYEYDSDAAGAPIYSFEKLDLSGEIWLLLNRAVPAVDYTGRTSCVSHTLAFREADLFAIAQEAKHPIPTVFEFVRNFKWVGVWDVEPRWEADDEVLTLASVFEPALQDARPRMNDRSTASLLAMECGKDGVPKPKRAAWKFTDETPDDILELFDGVWFCLDPWNGTRKHKDMLGEPDVGTVSSWNCTFATNLRNNRPDPYQWVVLPPKVSSMPNRETLEPAGWKSLGDADLRAKIDACGISDLLVERIQEGPLSWARRKLHQKLEHVQSEYESEVRKRNGELTSEVNDLLAEMERKVMETKEIVNEAKDQQCYVVSQETSDYISGVNTRFESIRVKARETSMDLFSTFRDESAPIRSLLGIAQADDESWECAPVFDAEGQKISSLGDEWKAIAPLADLYNCLKETRTNYTEKEEKFKELLLEKEEIARQKNDLYTQAASLQSENDRLQRKVLDYQKARVSASSRSSNILLWTTFSVVVVLAAVATWVTIDAKSKLALAMSEVNDLKRTIIDLKGINKNLQENDNPPKEISGFHAPRKEQHNDQRATSTLGKGGKANVISDANVVTEPPAGSNDKDKDSSQAKPNGSGQSVEPHKKQGPNEAAIPEDKQGGAPPPSSSTVPAGEKPKNPSGASQVGDPNRNTDDRNDRGTKPSSQPNDAGHENEVPSNKEGKDK